MRARTKARSASHEAIARTASKKVKGSAPVKDLTPKKSVKAGSAAIASPSNILKTKHDTVRNTISNVR